MTILPVLPKRVNIANISPLVRFCASSTIKISSIVLPRINWTGSAFTFPSSIRLNTSVLFEQHLLRFSTSASIYGSNFSLKAPGRYPRDLPTSIAALVL